jgi:hypothetical protein
MLIGKEHCLPTFLVLSSDTMHKLWLPISVFSFTNFPILPLGYYHLFPWINPFTIQGSHIYLEQFCIKTLLFTFNLMFLSRVFWE